MVLNLGNIHFIIYICISFTLSVQKEIGDKMESAKLVGLNTKWYRYQNKWTQEKFAEKTDFKMAYLSSVETGRANLTCKNIDTIANALNIDQELLFNKETALLAKNLPKRVDMYNINND